MPKARQTPEQRQQAAWDAADRRIIYAINGWCGVTGHSKEELGKMAGVGRSTFFKKAKNPGSFTVEEFRRLKAIIPEVEI